MPCDGSCSIKVSAVIPAYNSASFISRTIESAMAQTYPMTEIIVVDDGSTDRTAEVAERFPVRVIRRRNGGPGAARNTGIQAASGEWIAFLDSDDAWRPQKTEIQLRYAAPDIGVIHANVYDPITFDSLWQRRAFVTPSGALVRKQALSDVGGFEETRGLMGVEDLNLWLRIAMTDWRFTSSQTDLVAWTPAPGSQSSNDLRMARAELVNIDIISGLFQIPRAGAERVKRLVRLEYARNLISGGKNAEARELLNECEPGIASGWLRFAAFLGLRRMARTDVLQWLLSVESRKAT